MKHKYSETISLVKLKKSRYKRKVRIPRAYYRTKRKMQESAEALGVKERKTRREHRAAFSTGAKKSLWKAPAVFLRWIRRQLGKKRKKNR